MENAQKYSEIELCLSIFGNRTNLLLYIAATFIFFFDETIEWFGMLSVCVQWSAENAATVKNEHPRDMIAIEDAEPIMCLCTVCRNRNFKPEKKDTPNRMRRETVIVEDAR